MTQACQIIRTYIDEAGAKGLSKNLAPQRDGEVGVLASVSVPEERLTEMRGCFEPAFKRFVEATPAGQKAHIVDAFSGEDCNWRAVATEVRSDFFLIIGRLEIPIVYEARRLRVHRVSRDTKQDLSRNAKARRRSKIKVSERTDRTRVETELMTGLALKLDALCEDVGYDQINLLMDETDILDAYQAQLESVKNIGAPKTTLHTGFNSETNSVVKRQLTVQMQAPELARSLTPQYLGTLDLADKNDPLLLAADMVANSLFRHLSDLPLEHQLNAPSSISGWALEDRVHGCMDNGIQEFV